MKHRVLLIITLLASGAVGQDKPKLIGEIEFFGYSGIDLNKVRAVLPFREGGDFSMETFAANDERAVKAIGQLAGRAPTDLTPVCCDDQGNWIVYIGLSGKTIRYDQPPRSTIRLPENIVNLYDRFMKSLMEDVQKGASPEDRSKGYALSASPAMRSIQLEMRDYAVGHDALLRDVLRAASEDKQRIVAAQLLGYARQSMSQVAALVRAHRDSNGAVRNNATRALIVLAESSQKIAEEIPAEGFIELLLSGTWTDLNKASYLINSMTKSRNARLLARLRNKEVLERLIEMARWRTGHAEPARYILGRMAGIDEGRLQHLVKTGEVETIIRELHDK
jgi:hypothetical protein